MRLATFIVPMALVALCASPSMTFAQTGAKAEARKHFDRGLAQAKQGSYAGAIVEFNRAYEISPHFAVLYNLGQAYAALGQPVYAVQALKRYLNEGGNQVPAKRRNEVEADIARQDRQIASVTVRSQLAGAVIKVDGLDIGISPLPKAVRVNAGAHVFSASAPGYRPWEQRLVLPGQDQQVVEIRFEPVSAPATAPLPVAAAPGLAAAAPAPLAPSVPSPAAPAALAPAYPAATASATPAGQSGALPQPTLPVVVPPTGAESTATASASTQVSTPAPAATGSRRPVAYVVGGVGVGCLVAGGVFGLRAMSKLHDSDAHCPNNQCSPEGVALNDQAKTAALVSDITVGAGLVSLAVATYLLVTSGKVEPAPAGKLAYGIHLLPEVGPGEAKVTLGGSW